MVDAVHLESVGFCRASVLAEGPQRWMLAVPGRGSDEVSELQAALGSPSSCGRPPGWPWCWAWAGGPGRLGSP